MASRQTAIIQALAAVLDAMPEITTVNYQTVKLLASDFNDYELPLAQIIDISEDSRHEKARAEKTWNLVIELVIGPKEATSYVPTQTDLFDLRELVERAIWLNPKLGLPYVIQALLIGSSTDLHLLSPYYTAKIDLQIIYYQPLVDIC